MEEVNTNIILMKGNPDHSSTGKTETSTRELLSPEGGIVTGREEGRERRRDRGRRGSLQTLKKEETQDNSSERIKRRTCRRREKEERLDERKERRKEGQEVKEEEGKERKERREEGERKDGKSTESERGGKEGKNRL